jgi:hypothetical protein
VVPRFATLRSTPGLRHSGCAPLLLGIRTQAVMGLSLDLKGHLLPFIGSCGPPRWKAGLERSRATLWVFVCDFILRLTRIHVSVYFPPY